MTQTVVSHIGICTRDLDKTMAFYCVALGFKEVSKTAVGAEVGPLIELDDPEMLLRSHFLERGHFRIEVMAFDHPEPLGDNTAGAFNRIGLTHFAMHVDDLEAAIEAVEHNHGTVLRHTEVGEPSRGVRLIYVLDPNGVRIELMLLPGDKHAAPGEPV